MADPSKVPAELAVGIVGTGAVAAALSAAFGAETASTAVALWGRDRGTAASLAARSGVRHARELAELAGVDVVLIAVSDHAVGEVALALARDVAPGARRPVLLHTGGAVSGAEAMAGEGLGPFIRGSLHPLVAVGPHTRSFAGMPVAIEADGPRGLGVAGALTARLGAVALTVPSAAADPARTKLNYHALATMVATGVVALVERAAAAMEAEGGDREAFRRAYALLARSAAENLDASPGPEALTGVVARGDDALRQRHRESLRGERERALYDGVTTEAEAMLRDAGEGDPRR